MDYSQFRKISHKERIKLFLSSYSGFAAIVGLLCFIHCFLYHSLWINIEAPFQFMVSLGIVFDAYYCINSFLLYYNIFSKAA